MVPAPHGEPVQEFIESTVRQRKLGDWVRTSMNLFDVAHLLEGTVVPERHVDDSVVRKGREIGHSRDLLTTTQGRGGDEHARVLATESALCPEIACRVPERLWMLSASVFATTTRLSRLPRPIA